MRSFFFENELQGSNKGGQEFLLSVLFGWISHLSLSVISFLLLFAFGYFFLFPNRDDE